MKHYPEAALERAMKVQEVILRAIGKRITWWQAAEIVGISDRQMRRWKRRYEVWGYDGLYDRRRGQPSPRRVPLAVVEKVLELYREKYFDWNVRHFHEMLREEHGLDLRCTWVKLALEMESMSGESRNSGRMSAAKLSGMKWPPSGVACANEIARRGKNSNPHGNPPQAFWEGRSLGRVCVQNRVRAGRPGTRLAVRSRTM